MLRVCIVGTDRVDVYRELVLVLHNLLCMMRVTAAANDDDAVAAAIFARHQHARVLYNNIYIVQHFNNSYSYLPQLLN